jgi:FtsH-binding integral membrane protein
MEHAQPHYAPGQQQTWEDPRAQLHGNVEQFMAKVFGRMSLAVALTGAVAYGVGVAASQNAALMQLLWVGPLKWVVLFAPMVFVWIMGSRIPNMSPSGAKWVLGIHASLVGLMFSQIPLVITLLAASGDPQAVARAAELSTAVWGALGVTVGMYALTAAFGYFTKKDLSGMGRFLMMAAFGVFIAWMIGMFIPGFQTIIAAGGSVVFAGLTSYYTQSIKQMYLVNGGKGNLASLGALILYVNFINLFIMVLQLFMSRD